MKALTTRDIAKHYAVAPVTARKWVERRLFPNAQKIGRDWVVPSSDLSEFKRPHPGYPKGRKRK